MKCVMLSIRPEWVEKIVNGEKTIEVRKSAPKELPFKAYIYCTSQKFDGEILLTADKKVERRYKNCRDNGDIPLAGKVIGEFICDKVYSIKNQGSRFVVANEEQGVTNEIARQSCLDYDDMVDYLGNKDGYGWHISDLKIYDKPKEFSEFYTIPESGSDCCCGCVWHETPLYEMPCRTCTGERKYLYRPPQSWQYVEEVEEQNNNDN